jgi:hexosaminidase
MKHLVGTGNLWKSCWCAAGFFLANTFATAAAPLNLIPLPASVSTLPGHFWLSQKTTVAADTLFTNEAALLTKALHLASSTNADGDGIRLTAEGAGKLGDEAYQLEVGTHGVIIRARTAAGVFYGSQTLEQLVTSNSLEIPCVQIEDAPRYAWRGFMLDVSRHFFDENTVRQVIDQMAAYKLNRLHLHLTDDEAWRLEIENYPELTRIGARGNATDSAAPAQFFTRGQMQSLIAYAAQRHIVIVPEIDMPGHASAATRSFPQLDGGAKTFNPARPETYDFLQNVLLATMKTFPSPWIHIGGDEVNRASWEKNPEVREKMRTTGLASTADLEKYFMNRMGKFVLDHGHTPIGWDEIVAGNPAPGTIIFWWRHNRPDSLAQALAGGYSVVLTPRTPCYFDYPQNKAYPNAAWKLINTPETVYAGPVIPETINAAQRRQILGVEGCLWTERVDTVPYLQFMMMPRLAALSEMAWTPDGRRNFAQFNARLKPFLARLQQQGVRYYDEQDPVGSFRSTGKYTGNLPFTATAASQARN